MNFQEFVESLEENGFELDNGFRNLGGELSMSFARTTDLVQKISLKYSEDDNHIRLVYWEHGNGAGEGFSLHKKRSKN